jgi:hypothetical protein
MNEEPANYPEDKVINWMDGITIRIIHVLIFLLVSFFCITMLMVFTVSTEQGPFNFYLIFAVFGPFGMLNAAIYIFRIRFKR